MKICKFEEPSGVCMLFDKRCNSLDCSRKNMVGWIPPASAIDKEREKMSDNVNHPAHYTQGGICNLNGGWLNLGACPHELIVAAVPIDAMFCEMMNWAARYAIGRRTYAASDTARYLLKLVDKLDMQTLRCLRQDIEAATSLGDDCDEKEWLKLLDTVKEELERRGNER